MNQNNRLPISVLFVSSSNKKKRISPFILSQAESLERFVKIDLYTVDNPGFSGYIRHCFGLMKLLKHEKYDIIHAHYALCGFICAFARRKEILVTSLMGCDILGSYNKHGHIILRHRIIPFAAKFFSKYFWDYVILKSPNMIPEMKKKTRFSVIPNGVDLNLFKPMDRDECRSKLRFKDDTKYILFPTDPERQEKNFDLAKEAVRILKEKSDHRIKLEIVYNLSYSDLVVYYNAVDLCILTSHSEGSPNVIKECLACNTPVVSTDVGDVKELISGIDGCFISDSFPESFAAKMKEALEFNNKTPGREKVKHLSMESVAERINNVYTTLICDFSNE